jgi:hypothetical protein
MRSRNYIPALLLIAATASAAPYIELRSEEIDFSGVVLVGVFGQPAEDPVVFSTWTEKVLTGETLTEAQAGQGDQEERSPEEALAMAGGAPLDQPIKVKQRPPSLFPLASLVLFPPLALAWAVGISMRLWWREVMSWEETGCVLGEVGEDQAGAGAPDGSQALHHRPVMVQPSFAHSSHDHREFATDLVSR